jgi:hypothetical protein
MPDYPGMLLAIEKAQAGTKSAMENMQPNMKKLTQMESYVLGHLRAAQAVLDAAHDAVMKTRALRNIKHDPSAKKDPDEG